MHVNELNVELGLPITIVLLPDEKLSCAECAIFYSITSTQPGLQVGVTIAYID